MNQNDIRAIAELKSLSLDMINISGGGNPGICIDMAPVMYTLFTRILDAYPKNPNFFNRDRIILSSGHITPLYYAMLYMAGYPITKDDLKNFRRLNAMTPALPEMGNPIGVEATTGFAGDGVGIGVGLALGRRYLENLIHQEDDKINILDFTTYVFMSDADMMSGNTEEAFSFAEAQNLSNIVFLYDSNNISGEGPLNDVLPIYEKSFRTRNFYVDTIKDTTNIKEIARTIEGAKNAHRPALIIFENMIGKGTFNQGNNMVHSGPLSSDDLASFKRNNNIFLPPFETSKDSILQISHMMEERTTKKSKKWQESYERARSINSPSLNNILTLLLNGKVLISFQASNYKINEGYRESLLLSNSKIMNLIAPKSNLFIGGSAETALASQTNIGGENYHSSKNLLAKNIRFGAREGAMAFILNGLSLLGLRVFGSTKLCFADEMKSGIRLTAMMNNPVTYVFTHDSIYNSEEGPARIPVEELAMLRSTPNLSVYRPADITELMGCWETILALAKPSALVISRNSIPKLPGSDASKINMGAYIIKKEVSRLDGILISSGSEVVSSMQIAYDLASQGLDIRVVSVPCLELFLSSGIAYQESIISKNVKTIVIEASNDASWYRFTTSLDFFININDFGFSGIPIEVLQKMNFDYDSLKLKVLSLLK